MPRIATAAHRVPADRRIAQTALIPASPACPLTNRAQPRSKARTIDALLESDLSGHRNDTKTTWSWHDGIGHCDEAQPGQYRPTGFRGRAIGPVAGTHRRRIAHRLCVQGSSDDRLVRQLRGDCLITVFRHHVTALPPTLRRGRAGNGKLGRRTLIQYQWQP